jgi:hypothetical protein
MKVYIVREIETREFQGIFWGRSVAEIWDLFDEVGDPFGFEYAELKSGALYAPGDGLQIEQWVDARARVTEELRPKRSEAVSHLVEAGDALDAAIAIVAEIDRRGVVSGVLTPDPTMEKLRYFRDVLREAVQKSAVEDEQQDDVSPIDWSRLEPSERFCEQLRCQAELRWRPFDAADQGHGLIARISRKLDREDAA